MTEQDRLHILSIIDWFSVHGFKKYAAGTVEHGGHLPNKGGLLKEAEAESLDLPIYLRTLRVQLQRVLLAINEGRTKEAATALHRILNGKPDDLLPI